MNNQYLPIIINFFRKYGIFIAPLFLFLLFMTLIILSYSQTSSTTKQSPSTSPAISQNKNSASIELQNTEVSSNPSVSPSGTNSGMQESEEGKLGWSPQPFSPQDLSGLNATQTTLPDGSTQYTYASDTPDRPILLIVQKGMYIFERRPFYNTTIQDATNFYGNPEYVAYGSRFWGNSAKTEIFLSQGIAFVVNPSTNQALEQITFQPGNLQQFKHYNTDMIGTPQKN